MVKTPLVILVLFVSACIVGCCTDGAADAAGSPGGVQETPVQQRSDIDLSEIPVATPELIRTNGSYIAGIALSDERAQALIRHGGKPESVAVLFHSCPRNDPYCNQNPSLVIRYGDIRFAVTVDEATGTVLGGSALVPNVPNPNKPSPTYYKTRDISTGTDSVYLRDTLVMAYNETSLLYLNESRDQPTGAAIDTASAPEPCGEYVKTGEFVEVVGSLLNLLRDDPTAGRFLSDGGEITGVVVVCPPTAATEPVGPGCCPAVRVRYGEMTIDFLVNIDCMRIEKASIEVPPGYLSHTVDNVTYIIHDGDVVLAL